MMEMMKKIIILSTSICIFENFNSNSNQCILIQFKLHAMTFNIVIEWNLISIVFFIILSSPVVRNDVKLEFLLVG
jgi:hypothetical protein